MLIDGHAHACGVYLNEKSISAYLAAHEIDKVVLCGGEPENARSYPYPMFSNIFSGENLSYTFNRIIRKVTQFSKVAQQISQENDRIWQLAQAMPDCVMNAYWVNPTEDNWMEKLVQFHWKKSFYLIKLHQCWTDFDLETDPCEKLFDWAAAHRIPVFIHLWDHEQVLKFSAAANHHSKTTFVSAHMIGSDVMAHTLIHKNVYFDLSAPQLYSKSILQRALTNHGADRLILGSDSPYGTNNLKKALDRLNALELSESEFNMITSENILRILKQ